MTAFEINLCEFRMISPFFVYIQGMKARGQFVDEKIQILPHWHQERLRRVHSK